VGELDLAPYLGPCRVIHAIGVGPLIQWQHLAHAIDQLPPRVLVRTYPRMPVDRWDPDLAAFAPQTIERLAALGVLLVGIDTASIDPADSKTLDSPPGDPPPEPARAGKPGARRSARGRLRTDRTAPETDDRRRQPRARRATRTCLTAPFRVNID
jgi:kynurenine formamidase